MENLNVKAVEEVVKFVEKRMATGSSIEVALIELSNRFESTAGDIKNVAEYLGFNAQRYLDLKQELRLEKEIVQLELEL